MDKGVKAAGQNFPSSKYDQPVEKSKYVIDPSAIVNEEEEHSSSS
jgi:hypothetical protein